MRMQGQIGGGGGGGGGVSRAPFLVSLQYKLLLSKWLDPHLKKIPPDPPPPPPPPFKIPGYAPGMHEHPLKRFVL